MKKSKIKRLVPKKLAARLAAEGAGADPELRARAETEAAEVIAKMTAKGYRLVTRLETGEGVFVKEDDVVGLHVQLPGALYARVDATCHARGITKRQLVISALEQYLAREPTGG